MIDTYWCCGGLGQGFGAINMRDVSCSSNSLSLFSCSYNSNSYGCSHSDDVGIRCYGMSYLSVYKYLLLTCCLNSCNSILYFATDGRVLTI